MFNPENTPIPSPAELYAGLTEEERKVVEYYVLNMNHAVNEEDFALVEDRTPSTNERIAQSLQLLLRTEDTHTRKEIGKTIADLLVTWKD